MPLGGDQLLHYSHGLYRLGQPTVLVRYHTLVFRRMASSLTPPFHHTSFGGALALLHWQGQTPCYTGLLPLMGPQWHLTATCSRDRSSIHIVL